jgi:hypothetical protein
MGDFGMAHHATRVRGSVGGSYGSAGSYWRNKSPFWTHVGSQRGPAEKESWIRENQRPRRIHHTHEQQMDLVERLRAYLLGDQLYHPLICDEAAEEIERLIADVESRGRSIMVLEAENDRLRKALDAGVKMAESLMKPLAADECIGNGKEAGARRRAAKTIYNALVNTKEQP